MGLSVIDMDGEEHVFYMLLNTKTGQYSAGTGNTHVPKLYTKGTANQVCNKYNNWFKNHGMEPVWDVVEVALKIK